MPGDLRLSEFEADLSQLWAECFQRRPRGFKGTTALSRLVNHVCKSRSVDFVLYDAGPNVGALNRVLLLDCDYFIVPAACDLFSVRAITTLGRTLASWVNDWSTVQALAPDGTYLLPGLPDLLGYVPQRFRIYRGEVTQGQTGYISQIEKHLRIDVVKPLHAASAKLANRPFTRLQLGMIKDFGSLVQPSQAQGVAIANSTAGTAVQREEARAAFARIARRIAALQKGKSK